MIIDFHTHILPGIDDGSKHLDMSIEMLSEEYDQGVDVVIATPHFYASNTTLQKFLVDRDKAYRSITDKKLTGIPDILLGAEVAMFSRMDVAEDIELLCIENTKTMLIEMPFRQWTDQDVRMLRNLLTRGIVPIIAHIERDLKYQRQKKFLEDILDLPLYVQVNAEGLNSWHIKRTLLDMFKNGFAHLLGSDCHNISSRKPNLLDGRKIIRRRIGDYQLDIIDNTGVRILGLQETR